MEQRLRFNEDALAYDRARPRYTNKLFDAIDAYALLNGARALEIGPGTGQATRAMLERGAHVTAIELGESLAQVLSARLGSSPALNVITGDFMEYDAPDGAFDVIYSATAFHWLPQDAALKKIKRLLRPGGTLALFWNHPMAGAPGDAAYEGVRAILAHLKGRARSARTSWLCAKGNCARRALPTCARACFTVSAAFAPTNIYCLWTRIRIIGRCRTACAHGSGAI